MITSQSKAFIQVEKTVNIYIFISGLTSYLNYKIQINKIPLS